MNKDLGWNIYWVIMSLFCAALFSLAAIFFPFMWLFVFIEIIVAIAFTIRISKLKEKKNV